MKKIFLLTTLFCCVMAATAADYDFSLLLGENTLYFKITNKENKEVSLVPETNDSPYYKTKPIGDIAIPESVTYNKTDYSVTAIGNYAFYNCSGLTSIGIPGSVTSIGNYTFQKCTNLKSAIIPDNATAIAVSLFDNCSSLSSITIPNTVETIGNR